MEKVKEFIKKYKAEFIIALTAISSIVASIMTMEGSNAAICSVIIALVAVLINVLKQGFNETTISLIAKAIQIILEEVNKKEIKDKEKVNAIAVKRTVYLTSIPSIEEIKDRLKN